MASNNGQTDKIVFAPFLHTQMAKFAMEFQMDGVDSLSENKPETHKVWIV